MKSKILFLLILISQIQIKAQNDYAAIIQECHKKGFFESQKCMIGKEIPAFEVLTIDGERIKSSQLKNKITIINFWFMSCPPCIAELDGLNQVVREFEGNTNIEFLAFSTDSEEALCDNFFSKYELKFKVIPNSKELIVNTFHHKWGFPTTMIIDRTGKIHAINIGGLSPQKEASKEIRQFLINGIKECL